MVIVLSRASILESRIKHFILLLDLVSLFILEQSPSFCDNDPLKRLGSCFVGYSACWFHQTVLSWCF